MNGPSHTFVAMLAMACLGDDERRILYPRWSGIEAGATLSDEFRIMWEVREAGSKNRELVHRCFVDSTDTKDHGCVTRALHHAEGSVSFIRSYLSGELKDAYNEEQFLEDLGMFMGVAGHHVADLCTPVHVGHRMDYEKVGAKSRAAFHRKVWLVRINLPHRPTGKRLYFRVSRYCHVSVFLRRAIERDIGRLLKQCVVKMSPAESADLSRDYFWAIAQETYDAGFLRLKSFCQDGDEEALLEIASGSISRAVRHTRNVWHIVLSRTKMTERKWSLQPLL